MIPTTKRREALKSAVVSDADKAGLEAAITADEAHLIGTATEANQQRLAAATADGARTFEAMGERIERYEAITREPRPNEHRTELRWGREELDGIDLAIERFEDAIAAVATVAADPLGHANSLLERYPALGGQ